MELCRWEAHIRDRVAKLRLPGVVVSWVQG